MTLDLKALEGLPMGITYETVWEGEYPNRTSRPNLERVSGVYLGLTPSDWCEIAMREGGSYIGGCCGTTSGMQDVVNGIFREGGWANADDMWTLGEYAKAHPDGFKEDFTVRWKQKRFDEQCAKWEKLDPWKKIAIAWQAVRDKVKPYSHNADVFVPDEPRPDLDDKRAIDELYGAISFSHFSIFRFEAEDDKWKQRHAEDVLTMAKLLMGAKALIRKLEGNFTQFTGVALVEKDRPDVITHNGHGACVFSEREGAEELMALWRRFAKEDKEKDCLADKVLIRPVKISVQKGIEFTD